MKASARRPVLLPAGKQQGIVTISKGRRRSPARPACQSAARRHHAWTQVAEPSCRRSADNSGRTSPASEPPASLPASIAVIRAGMEFTGVETRPPRTAGHGADLRPPARQPRREPGPTAGGIISRAGSAAVSAAPARRRPGRFTRPPPIPSQACRAVCFQACALCLASGMRAPPDIRHARAGRALGMHAARKHRRA